MVSCSYPERREVVLGLDEVLDGGPDLGEHPVDDVHDPVGGDLVSMDDSGTVHGDNLSSSGETEQESDLPIDPRRGQPFPILNAC